MNMVKGWKLCMRMFRQLGISRIPRDIQGSKGLMGCDHQIRHFRSDEPQDWTAMRADDAIKQMNQKYSDEMHFESRYDPRAHKGYDQQGDSFDQIESSQTGMRDPESRRLITQDTSDHQRRQERIIEENRRRWQNRVEPKSPAALQYERGNQIFGDEKPGKKHQRRGGNEEQTAEEYSKRRRAQRLKEKTRQERELRESRKGYNLPKSEGSEPSASTTMSTASQEWLARKAEEEEAKYWHSWTTCPDERRRLDAEKADAETAEHDDDDSSSGYKKSDRRGFIKPTLPYDSSVRRFQTHSQLVTAAQVRPVNYGSQQRTTLEQFKPERRRPSGMEKQIRLIKDFNRLKTVSRKRPLSLLQSHVFKSPKTKYSERRVEENLEDMELPQQMPRPKLAWQGLPRPVYKRFDGINRAIARKTQCQSKNAGAKKCVEPPRFKMTLRSKKLSRKRTPTDSFSNTLTVNTHFTPHSEYTGYGRQTVCDAWQNFSNFHYLKQIY